LTELGYADEQNSSNPGENEIFPGGETEALQRLNLTVTNRKQWVAKFEKPKTSPNALQPDTTGLSPYIKHGCLSARTVYHELQTIYDLYPNQHSKPPVSLHGQLMWREYNTLMGYTTPNFDRMIRNPVARQIPWDNDPMLVNAWKTSQTGYPFIDAIMAQLKHTGWIHHLARHAVACFLTRGDLWQSWEQGALYFEEALIDADWSINNFNWQWLSCTAHFYQYFRCYSPVAFGKKTDPQGNYIRKWLPLFHKVPLNISMSHGRHLYLFSKRQELS
jgi:cryptochrome